MQNVSVSDPSSNSTILTDLSPGTIYMIQVAGINTRGVGNYSEFAIAQTFTGNIFSSCFFYCYLLLVVYSATFLLPVPNTTSESASIMILHPGIDFHLSCVFSGIPQPLLTWYRDGVVLMDGSGGVSIVSSWNTSELAVTDIGGRQGGEYNCSGTNAAGLSSLAFTVECKLFVYFIHYIETIPIACFSTLKR